MLIMRIICSISILCFLVCFGGISSAYASTIDGTIAETHSFAWGENVGWINFASIGNIHVSDTQLTGYAWVPNYGWINLQPAEGGVQNDGSGNLSGYAWGEQLGYIDFSGVRIDARGIFHGYATSPATGTISFNCENEATCADGEFYVETDWRPASVRNRRRSSDSGGSGSGGSSGSSDTTSPPSQNTNSPEQTRLPDTTLLGSEPLNEPPSADPITSVPPTPPETPSREGLMEPPSPPASAVPSTTPRTAINTSLTIGEVANFSVREETHDLVITNITEDVVSIVLHSEPIVLELKKSVTQEVDLDGDRKNDVRVVYLGLENGRAKIVMITLEAPLAHDPSTQTAPPRESSCSSVLHPLGYGKKNIPEDVRQLQIFLNTHGALIATSGPGSPGQETTFYGSLTTQAVNVFQKMHIAEILSASGMEPIAPGDVQGGTLSVINHLLCSEHTTPAQQKTDTTPTKGFLQNLRPGDIGPDVRLLQLFLNTHGSPVATFGIGSPGQETSYFGPKCQAALVAFQNKHAAEILKPVNLTKGNGLLGPSTRTFINSLIEKEGWKP